MRREVGGHCHTRVGIAAGTVISIRALHRRATLNLPTCEFAKLFLPALSIGRTKFGHYAAVYCDRDLFLFLSALFTESGTACPT